MAERSGWCDTFGPISGDVLGAALAGAASTLTAGQSADVKQSDVPAAVWDRHRVKYSDPKRHGLRLEDKPDRVSVFRYADGGIGMSISYSERIGG